MKRYKHRKVITAIAIMLALLLTACAVNDKKETAKTESPEIEESLGHETDSAPEVESEEGNAGQQTENPPEQEVESVPEVESEGGGTDKETETNTSAPASTPSNNASSEDKAKTSSTPKKDESSSGNHIIPQPSSQAGCTHTWITRTETKEEPIETLVTAERREYTLYRFYWYHTGEWEETRDHERFDEWMKSSNGSWYPILTPYPNPEDNPLFIGYDENGHETYTNDHVIISNLFEWVPCEPYKKIEMTTVTVTTIVCSKCGAVK